MLVVIARQTCALIAPRFMSTLPRFASMCDHATAAAPMPARYGLGNFLCVRFVAIGKNHFEGILISASISFPIPSSSLISPGPGGIFRHILLLSASALPANGPADFVKELSRMTYCGH